MALLFMDGFDHYDPKTYAIKWDNGSSDGYTSWASTGGRRGGGAYRLGDYSNPLVKTLAASYQTLILGFAFNYEANNPPQDYNWKLCDGSTDHILMRLNISSRYLEVFRAPSTLLDTYSIPLTAGVWYYLELKVKIDDSAGIIQLRVNEYLALDLSGIDTRNGGNASVNKVKFQGKYNTSGNAFRMLIDDVYICDTSGAQNNDFLGDVRIDTLLPGGPGASTQWTPSANANYQCVDDAAFDNGADYISDTLAGHQDSFAFADLPAGITGIKGIQTNLLAKRTDSGVATKLKPVIRVGGADYLKTECVLSTAYWAFPEVTELNPATSAAWTKTDIDDAEFGVNLSANPI
jgi:hypothetical protein